jgi:hypothetical protein
MVIEAPLSNAGTAHMQPGNADGNQPPVKTPLEEVINKWLKKNKLWSQYLECTKGVNKNFKETGDKDLDSLLVFVSSVFKQSGCRFHHEHYTQSGLFSAILTAFLIEIRKGLQEETSRQKQIPCSSNLSTPSPTLHVLSYCFLHLSCRLHLFGPIRCGSGASSSVWPHRLVPISQKNWITQYVQSIEPQEVDTPRA